MKYQLGDIVSIQRIISGKGEVINRWKPDNDEISIYQLRVLEGVHKGKTLWFAENEIVK